MIPLIYKDMDFNGHSSHVTLGLVALINILAMFEVPNVYQVSSLLILYIVNRKKINGFFVGWYHKIVAWLR